MYIVVTDTRSGRAEIERLLGEYFPSRYADVSTAFPEDTLGIECIGDDTPELMSAFFKRRGATVRHVQTNRTCLVLVPIDKVPLDALRTGLREFHPHGQLPEVSGVPLDLQEQVQGRPCLIVDLDRMCEAVQALHYFETHEGVQTYTSSAP